MAKTPLFSSVTRILRQACWLEQNPQARLPERRDFLKTVAAGAALLPATNFLAHRALAESVENIGRAKEQDPIVILGGGLSGLTAAYRLKQARMPCVVYEGAPRLGGRVFTMNKFNSEGMFCELGGELIDTDQNNMLGLARELGLSIDDFKPGDKGVEPWLFYFGGQHYYEKDALAAFRPLAAHMRADIKKAFPKEKGCNYKSHTPEAAKLDQISIKEYLYSKKDVEKWVLDIFNVAYLGEYGADTELQSCLNLLVLAGTNTNNGLEVFEASDESKRISGGNSRLIDALEKAIQPKVPVHLGMELIGIKDSGGSLLLSFRSGGTTKEVRARQVICTLPFTTLRLVDGIDTLGLSPRKLQCIKELGYGINTKYMLGFKDKLWRDPLGPLRPSTAYTFTDLPTQSFWESSRAQKGKSGIITNFMGGKDAAAYLPDRLKTTLTDLERIMPGITARYDGNQALFQWAHYSMARGSYTCAKPGQTVTLVGSPGEPELGGRLLFAGEHVSEANQGYMEGAVESANTLVRTLSRRKTFAFR